MGAIASQITSLTIVYSTIYSGADQSKHQSSVSLDFVWGIHRGPVNSPHKWPVTRKMFPFDDVIMIRPSPPRNHSDVWKPDAQYLWMTTSPHSDYNKVAQDIDLVMWIKNWLFLDMLYKWKVYRYTTNYLATNFNFNMMLSRIILKRLSQSIKYKESRLRLWKKKVQGYMTKKTIFETWI